MGGYARPARRPCRRRPSSPTFTTDIAKKTLPKEKISSFTTYFQPGQPRVHNIKLASRVINGTYVPPGEQFSMNAVLGQRTAAKGYVEAGIIRNGRAAESVGGGISQVSTTIFNASFFAGVELDAWTPHYYYISRYPEGREATISWPDLHNKFTNTTDGGILIQVATTDTSITVSYWGTKKYDVTATKSARYDIVQPKKYDDDGPDCLNQSPVVGFKVDIGRIFKQGGKVVKTAEVHDDLPPRGRRHLHESQALTPGRGSSLPRRRPGEVDVLVVALEPTPLVEREGLDVVRIGLQVQRRGTVVRGGHGERRQHP